MKQLTGCCCDLDKKKKKKGLREQINAPPTHAQIALGGIALP